MKAQDKAAQPPSLWRFCLQITLVLLAVAAASVAFRTLTGPQARFQRLLDQETEALTENDRQAFMALQDQEDVKWQAAQQDWIETVGSIRKLGRPVPRPVIVRASIEGRRGWAEVKIESGGVADSQVMFFRHDGYTWRHCAPDPAYWGDVRTRETGQLRWVYRERDETSVFGAVDRCEAMCEQMQTDLGVAITTPITIQLDYTLESYLAPLYPDEPTLLIDPPLLSLWDEGMVTYSVAAALAGYLVPRAAGLEPSAPGGYRAQVVSSLVTWEAERVLGTGRADPNLAAVTETTASGRLLALDEVWPERRPASSALRLGQGLTLLDYMAEVYGMERIAGFAHALSGAATLEDALRRALGPDLDIDEFQLGWLDYIREHYRAGQ